MMVEGCTRATPQAGGSGKLDVSDLQQFPNVPFSDFAKSQNQRKAENIHATHIKRNKIIGKGVQTGPPSAPGTRKTKKKMGNVGGPVVDFQINLPKRWIQIGPSATALAPGRQPTYPHGQTDEICSTQNQNYVFDVSRFVLII